MKTSSVTHLYARRIMSLHPVPKRNVLYFECSSRDKDNMAPHGYEDMDMGGEPIKGWEKGTWTVLTRPENNICPYCGSKVRIHERGSRIIRFAAESLPTDKGSTGNQSKEIKNSVYPEFKKWLPDFLIKRDPKTGRKEDITVRNPSVTLLDIWDGADFNGLKYEGHDIVIEFTSYNQTVQSGAGVQRMSILTDEEPPFDFWEEQLPRLLAEDGDMVLTLTPANRLTWTYDSIFESAGLYVRTEAVCDFLSKERGSQVPQIELIDKDYDIAVIQAATDDNPTLSPEVIRNMFNKPDPDGVIIPTRRYGIFRQATGRIFKDFNFKIHTIDRKKYFSHPLSSEDYPGWVFARTEDYHTANPLAILWVALSPQNEMFVYREWGPSPDKWVTKDMCREMAKKSGNTVFRINLIDPLANSTNNNTGKKTTEEMNEHFRELARENIGTGGFWEAYNTKGEVGRDAIKERLQNSTKVGVPYNNAIIGPRGKTYLPTMWVFRECPEMIRSLKHWRLESWEKQKSTKDRKETPAQKWSHYCTALEGLLKDRRFRPKSEATVNRRKYNYMQVRGRR